MSSSILRGSPRQDTHGCARPVHKQLDRFPQDARQAVSALARRHSRLADLSLSFPALLLALARPRASFRMQPVIDAVVAGAPLAALAGQAGVPVWLRRLPPQLLPNVLPALPDNVFLRHRIVNHFPTHPKQAAPWFEAISASSRWAHDGFALWCARTYGVRLPQRRAHLIRLLCLWAWFSGRPDTRGYALMEKPWHPDMTLRAALDAAWTWQEMLELDLDLGATPVTRNWLEPGFSDGYEFLPLPSAAEIDEEAAAMRNCLRTYSADVRRGYSRLWSVRRDGERIATLEVNRTNNILIVGQLCLAGNAPAPPPLWLAATRWLVNQDVVLPGPPTDWRTTQPQRGAWVEIWKPYWLAKRTVPSWLPLSPSRDTLYDFRCRFDF
jgi:hypothetical protein